MAVFICTLIFKISRMHTYQLCVHICVWEVGGCGVGWGGVVMWVCKREKEIYVWVCVCVNSCIFNMSLLTCIF